ncbi:unnamed protein product [Chondrus crispus]|uniref:RING-type E3 ubiquitin transferase n=1 Tax=Chondrus crispus TaxID=2769 RepID=R7QEF1_CHOCR|nr:unnamed protein product [Chondrus crispus]CDF36444.1 unnamed protein product [Chondrus crispus]|eukprot:XP_005716263.1 unnamed protein product [Chondrus crispus]
MTGEGNEKRSAVILKKRSRTSSRRRVRVSTEENDDATGKQGLELVAKDRIGKRKRKEWERPHFSANGKLSEPSAIATAVREDIGGEANPHNKRKKPFGPMQAPAHIRTSVRVDYQADICKDYKETGYCGFGDSCKFLHDRSDYKAGWQLERDWAEKEKLRREKVIRGENPDEESQGNESQKDLDEDGLPFACYICRGDFKNPVVTICHHYFCEQCALDRLSKDSTCAICRKQLSGTLNVATKLVAKLKTKLRKSQQ